MEDPDEDKDKSKETNKDPVLGLQIFDIGMKNEYRKEEADIDELRMMDSVPGASSTMSGSEEKSDDTVKEAPTSATTEPANPFEEGEEEPAELEPMLDGSKKAVKKDKDKRDTPMRILMNMGNTLKETPLLKKKRQEPKDENVKPPAGVLESVKAIASNPKQWAYEQGLLVALLITLKFILIILDYLLSWAFYYHSMEYYMSFGSVGYNARYVYLFYLIINIPIILWELVCIFFEHRFCAGAKRSDDEQMFWFLFGNSCALFALNEFPMAIVIAVIVQYSCNCSLLVHLLALAAVQAKMWFAFFVFIKRAVCFEKTLVAMKLPTLKWVIICILVIVPTFVVKLMLIIFAHIPAQNRTPMHLTEVRVLLTYGANYTILVQQPTFCDFDAGAHDQVNYCHRTTNNSVFHGRLQNASWGGHGFQNEVSEVSVPCDQLFLQDYEEFMFAKPGILTDCKVVLDMKYDPSTHKVEYTALLKSKMVHHQVQSKTDTAHKFWIDHITRPIPVPWTDMGMEYVTDQLKICNHCRKGGTRTCPSILPHDLIDSKNMTNRTPLLICSTWCKAGCNLCTMMNDPVKNGTYFKSLDECTCNTNNCNLTTSCVYTQANDPECNRENLHIAKCAPQPVRAVCQDPSSCELQLSQVESHNPLGPLKVEVFGCGDPETEFKSSMQEEIIH